MIPQLENFTTCKCHGDRDTLPVRVTEGPRLGVAPRAARPGLMVVRTARLGLVSESSGPDPALGSLLPFRIPPAPHHAGIDRGNLEDRPQPGAPTGGRWARASISADIIINYYRNLALSPRGWHTSAILRHTGRPYSNYSNVLAHK